MNNEKIQAYYTFKLFSALIFDNYNELYLSVPDIYSIDSLNTLKKVITVYINHKVMSENMKNNICIILSEAREVEDDNRDKRINIINEIIRLINECNEDSIYFYIKQLIYRRKYKEIKNYNIQDIINEIPNIDDSIVNDFLVLETHSKEYTSEEFKNDFLQDFIDNRLYYENLKTILRECPSMFEDKIFLERIKSVMECNNYKNKEYKKINSLVKRRIKQLNKLD